jgi:hypothetical protein
VTIPKTFSAPSDATFPALNGYAPSVEDCLRYAVWLMFYADDLNRKTYSYDDADPAKGVRIVQQDPMTESEDGVLTFPQQIIAVAVPNTKTKLQTGGAATQTITIAVLHLDKVRVDWLETDITAPMLTPEARMARWKEILMRGTLVDESYLTAESSVVVDPYYTPRNEDGTYDATQLKLLCARPPDITPAAKRTFPARPVSSEQEWWSLDPVRDFALSFGVFATYSVDLSNRGNMRRGG